MTKHLFTCFFALIVSLHCHANNKAYDEGLLYGSDKNASLFTTFDDPDVNKELPFYSDEVPADLKITESDFVPKAGSMIDTDEDANFAYKASESQYFEPYEVDRNLLHGEKTIRDNADEIASGSGYCDDGECYEYDEIPNEDFASATTALRATFEGGTQYDDPTVDIFKGKAGKCEKSKLTGTDCCDQKGWMLDWKIKACGDEAKKLAEEKEKGLCFYVGSYTKRKSFGRKIKYESYCCFESKLGLATQRDGRPQLGKSWGSSKYPNCSGFTIHEYERLDYSKIDLSDSFGETEKQYSEPTHKSPKNIADNHKPHAPEDIKTW